MRIIVENTGRVSQDLQYIRDFMGQNFPESCAEKMSLYVNLRTKEGKSEPENGETYIISGDKAYTLDEYLTLKAERALLTQIKKKFLNYKVDLEHAKLTLLKCEQHLGVARKHSWKTVPKYEALANEANQTVNYLTSMEPICNAILDGEYVIKQYHVHIKQCGSSYYKLYGACLLNVNNRIIAIFGNGHTSDMFMKNAEAGWEPVSLNDYIYLVGYKL